MRAPLVSLTIVMTLAIGLGLIGVLFTVFNLMLFRVDNVPDINEMFAVERPRNERDESEPFTRPQFEAMQRETRVFSGMYAEVSDVESRTACCARNDRAGEPLAIAKYRIVTSRYFAG